MKEQEIKDLKIGDVLKLNTKAYGPFVVTDKQMKSIDKDFHKLPQKVTVEDFTTSNKVVCVWFDENNEPHRELLTSEELEKLD